jgi:hypothetical protein
VEGGFTSYDLGHPAGRLSPGFDGSFEQSHKQAFIRSSTCIRILRGAQVRLEAVFVQRPA